MLKEVHPPELKVDPNAVQEVRERLELFRTRLMADPGHFLEIIREEQAPPGDAALVQFALSKEGAGAYEFDDTSEDKIAADPKTASLIDRRTRSDSPEEAEALAAQQRRLRLERFAGILAAWQAASDSELAPAEETAEALLALEEGTDQGTEPGLNGDSAA